VTVSKQVEHLGT